MKWLVKWLLIGVFLICLIVVLIIWDILSLVWCFKLQTIKYVIKDATIGGVTFTSDKNCYNKALIDDKWNIKAYKSYWHYWYDQFNC